MRKTITAIVAGLIVMVYGAMIFMPVYAENVKELETKLNKVNEDMDQTQKQLDKVKSQKEDALKEKEEIDKDIEQTENELEQIDMLLIESEKMIKEAEKKLTKATEESEKQYELLKLRARTMYEDGNATYLEVLLNAKSISDFLSRIEIIKDIIKYDTALLEKLKANQQLINKEKEKQEYEKNNRKKIKNQVLTKRDELNRKEISRQKIIQRLTTEEQECAKALERLEEASKKVEEEIQKIQAQSTRKYSGGTLAWPTPSCYTITSSYGNRYHPILKKYKLHTGTDIGASSGASVVAANDGQVIFSGWNGAYGNCIIIDHGGGISTLYAHNSSLLVKYGQEVKKGQAICKVGSTGYSTGPHLHFEVRVNGKTVDPMSYYN